MKSQRIPLGRARRIAERIRKLFAPHCQRIQIAGSIRRKKRDIGDVEIVCIPTAGIDLFGKSSGRNEFFLQKSIPELGKRIKGDLYRGKYIQYLLPEGIKLDLFIADQKNYGLILAIRTGSALYSHHVLARGWVKAGYQSENGYLRDRSGKMIDIPEEEDLFRLIGIPYIPPEARDR